MPSIYQLDSLIQRSLGGIVGWLTTASLIPLLATVRISKGIRGAQR